MTPGSAGRLAFVARRVIHGVRKDVFNVVFDKFRFFSQEL